MRHISLRKLRLLQKRVVKDVDKTKGHKYFGAYNTKGNRIDKCFNCGKTGNIRGVCEFRDQFMLDLFYERLFRAIKEETIKFNTEALKQLTLSLNK